MLNTLSIHNCSHFITTTLLYPRLHATKWRLENEVFAKERIIQSPISLVKRSYRNFFFMDRLPALGSLRSIANAYDEDDISDEEELEKSAKKRKLSTEEAEKSEQKEGSDYDIVVSDEEGNSSGAGSVKNAVVINPPKVTKGILQKWIRRSNIDINDVYSMYYIDSLMFILFSFTFSIIWRRWRWRWWCE